MNKLIGRCEYTRFFTPGALIQLSMTHTKWVEQRSTTNLPEIVDRNFCNTLAILIEPEVDFSDIDKSV